MVWINKNWSLQQVHFEIFKYFRKSLVKFYTVDGLKNPFKAATREEFEALSDQDAFQMIFPTLTTENWKNLLSKNDLDIKEALYTLRIKNMTGYMESCQFCGDKRCEGCPLPFEDN